MSLGSIENISPNEPFSCGIDQSMYLCLFSAVGKSNAVHGIHVQCLRDFHQLNRPTHPRISDQSYLIEIEI